jgi:predicted RNA-binding Zn-ribbon protein involved in translation (DUF1610 family)
MVSDLLEPGAEQFARPVLRGLGGSNTPWLPGGREVVAVPPQYTSQDCSGCGTRVPKSLSVRTHGCPHCGLILDRDHNAALNIQRVGQTLRGYPRILGEMNRESPVL